MQEFIAKVIGSTILYWTGYRFNKSNRHEDSLLYKLIWTTRCNQFAEYKKLGIK